jgi:hypothetical protein
MKRAEGFWFERSEQSEGHPEPNSKHTGRGAGKRPGKDASVRW